MGAQGSPSPLRHPARTPCRPARGQDPDQCLSLPSAAPVGLWWTHWVGQGAGHTAQPELEGGVQAPGHQRSQAEGDAQWGPESAKWGGLWGMGRKPPVPLGSGILRAALTVATGSPPTAEMPRQQHQPQRLPRRAWQHGHPLSNSPSSLAGSPRVWLPLCTPARLGPSRSSPEAPAPFLAAHLGPGPSVHNPCSQHSPSQSGRHLCWAACQGSCASGPSVPRSLKWPLDQAHSLSEGGPPPQGLPESQVHTDPTPGLPSSTPCRPAAPGTEPALPGLRSGRVWTGRLPSLGPRLSHLLQGLELYPPARATHSGDSGWQKL